jgi:hypothetical protein
MLLVYVLDPIVGARLERAGELLVWKLVTRLNACLLKIAFPCPSQR